ncbi:flagellar basal-body MS-ring/collar protein FliF [Kaarinaea lacus]
MATAELEDHSTKPHGLDTLTIVRQLGLFIGLAASVAIGVWVVLWSQEPNYSVLYGTLEETEASLVMDALQQLNISYKLDDSTGALMVPSKNVHDARIKLAAQGLPKSASGGFNSLNTQDNTFGISETKENLIYQKALEQELSRTIVSLSNVRTARVHLAIPKQSVFVRNRQKPRASVIVSLYSGRNINEGQVAAISHLVASSVPNLDVEHVTVVDQQGRLLTTGGSSREMALTSTQFDYARKLEKSYIERIENILIPILGPEAVKAQVTADLDFTYSEQTQEQFNPDSQVPVSEQISEELSTGRNTGGIPGALSNQPPGAAEVPENATAEANTEAKPSSRSTRREVRNYEMDKTISHTRYSAGRLRRLSAAVVLDDKVTVNANGEKIRTQRSPEEIERITELVKKAIGFNIQRGDSVNVINESFTEPLAPMALPEQPIWEQAWIWDVAKQALGGLLVLLILFGVLKPAIKNLSRTITPIMNVPEPAASPAPALPNMQEDQLSLTGGEAQQQLPGPGSPYEKNMMVAQQAVKDDPKLVAQVVKNWIADE